MVFDAYIEKMHEFIHQMRAVGRSVKVWQAQGRGLKHRGGLDQFPVAVGTGAQRSIILRSDTYAELGNPEIGSAAISLFTNQTSLVQDGRITLIGPDIAEIGGQSVPFGQIVIVGGKALRNDDVEKLQRAAIVGDRIEGYLMRSLPQSIWSRVSKDAAAKGFSFEVQGKALQFLFKTENPKIEMMEVVFVTSGREDVKALGELAVQVRKISREIVRENWKIKGYDIDCSQNCSTCADKPVCDDIREVLLEKEAKASRSENDRGLR